MSPFKPNKRLVPLIPALFSLIFIVAGCASDPWTRYDMSLYGALKYPGEETLESHATLLHEIIVSAEKKKLRPPPGVCAEFAFYTARLGKTDLARKALAREVHYYPESSKFVAIVTKMLDGPKPEPAETGESPEPKKSGE